MAILTFEEIKEIILSDTPDWVKKTRKDSKKLNVHINGIGTADYLSHIEGYENKTQYELRRKFATSNKFIFENLSRPVDKVFSANGGSVLIDTSTDSSKKLIKDKILNFDGGYSLRKWLENIQSNNYYSDPSGVVFFEWDKIETWPTLKSIHSVRNYQKDGRNLDWIIFEPEKRKKVDSTEFEGDFYRFVDSSKDYLFYVIEKEVTLIEEETFINPFGIVPAIINSNLLSSTLDYNVSPFDNVIELADHYLRTTSVKNIYEFLHGYPIFWAYVEPCRTCEGTGLYQGETCHSCNGDGHTFKKDVSDVIKLKPPTQEGQPVLAPNVAGYVQPDLSTWEQQRNELDWLWSLIHFATWGTSQERAENETATAAFIDVQPVNDRLNKFADAFEQTEKLIIDLLGKFYLKTNYKGVSVNYGRRFLVESPDKVWEKYQTAREKGSPKSTLDYLLSQYYNSEFKDDVKTIVVMTKAMEIEPFIHMTEEQVLSMPVSNEDKLRKIYFNEFWKSLDREMIMISEVDKLKSEFETYISNKKIENERTEVSGVQSNPDEN